MKNPTQGHQNVVWFLEKMFERVEKGTLPVEKYQRYEMLELEYNPNNKKDMKAYYEYVERLGAELDDQMSLMEIKLKEVQGLYDTDIEFIADNINLDEDEEEEEE